MNGKLDRDVHNGAQYGLGLMLKALELEHEWQPLPPADASGRPLLDVTGLNPDQAAALTYQEMVCGRIDTKTALEVMGRCAEAEKAPGMPLRGTD